MPGNKHLGTQDHAGVGRITRVPPPFAWTEAARLIDVLRMDQAFDPRYPDSYTEYTWDNVSGNLIDKRVYATSAKLLHLFTVEYTFDANDLLTTKTVTRETDGAVMVFTYTWDTEERLIAKDSELTQPDLYPGL